MRLGFYYHVSAQLSGGNARLPGYFGVFLDALADEVEQLVLIIHEANEKEKDECDYELRAQNITIVSLGIKTPAWHREIFHKSIIQRGLSHIENCDVFLVRAPSPLAPYFSKYIDKPKLWFMIVGDNVGALEQYKRGNLRQRAIYYYLCFNDIFFQRQIRQTSILVNSPQLYSRYAGRAPETHEIRTTTLSEKDLYSRTDTCNDSVVNLLYSGVFTPEKGLFEIIDALKMLVVEQVNVHLHMLGWERGQRKTVQEAVIEKARELMILERLTFHERRSVGSELNAMYRMADIFVFPSHSEGFPRVIWESMANSLPVVATTVGGIPGILENGKHAVLIPPKDPKAVASAIKRVIQDGELRRRLIKEGFALAQLNTLSKQTKKLVDILKEQCI